MMPVCDEREYARLLGYPWGTLLEGDARERAEQAERWYRTHGKPAVWRQSLPEAEGWVAAITAGAEVDRETERLWDEGLVDEAYFLDRYAAAVVENLAASLGPHRSPGTGGLAFEEQFKVFALLTPLGPGISLLPSGMLSPKNSLLAVSHPGIDAENPCTECGLPGCTFRRIKR